MQKLTIGMAALFLVASALGCGAADVADDPVFSEAPKDIFAAAQTGDVERVRQLIANGQWDYGAADNDGKLPLQHAVENGNPEIITMMIQNGASPHVRGTEGRTLIEIAREHGNEEAVAVLQQFGAPE